MHLSLWEGSAMNERRAVLAPASDRNQSDAPFSCILLHAKCLSMTNIR